MTDASVIVTRVIRDGDNARGLLRVVGPGRNDDLRALACWKLRLLRFNG